MTKKLTVRKYQVIPEPGDRLAHLSPPEYLWGILTPAGYLFPFSLHRWALKAASKGVEYCTGTFLAAREPVMEVSTGLIIHPATPESRYGR